ncbi:hypothetical protein [Campylobacter sputorum]|uniref:hypothetical protein n=1 Tax=Campylobacter sputorum TaxID=206 RepID=UPI00053BEE53|nr:hypothetical protein [Campylobacter sputorum]
MMIANTSYKLNELELNPNHLLNTNRLKEIDTIKKLNEFDIYSLPNSKIHYVAKKFDYGLV